MASYSPLGPIHLAHPSAVPNHLPFTSLFSRLSSKPKSSASSSAPPTKRSKTSLVISSPTLVSTSNEAVLEPAPSYSPRPFSPEAAFASRSSSPPPPYRPASLQITHADEFEPSCAGPPLEDQPLIPEDIVEERVRSWEVERLERQDREIVAELRRLGV
ncbi:hypothetical protein JCM10207_000699 [Rhodosporidiobolus poonsookiae]